MVCTTLPLSCTSCFRVSLAGSIILTLRLLIGLDTNVQADPHNTIMEGFYCIPQIYERFGLLYIAFKEGLQNSFCAGYSKLKTSRTRRTSVVQMEGEIVHRCGADFRGTIESFISSSV